MSEALYPPLDTMKRVADDVWIVDSGPLHAAGMPLPVRMTVLGPGDDLIFAHGTWFEHDGAARLRESSSWLLT